jgi:hypothetical protein
MRSTALRCGKTGNEVKAAMDDEYGIPGRRRLFLEVVNGKRQFR